MIIYDLANHLLQSTTIECLRYSNAKQSVVVRIVGTVPTAAYWQAAIALSTRLVESEILARNEAADVAISGNDITIKFKTSTNNWLAAASECPNGVRAWMVLRPFDANGEEMDYILAPVMVFPVVDPTGVMPPPSEVTANYVVTINGAGGNLIFKDSTGATLTVTSNVIQLTSATVGLGNVQNILDNLTATAAPTATDDSTKGYSKKSQWIYDGKFYTCVDATANAAVWTEGGGGAGDVTAAGDNTFDGANTFTQPITIDDYAFDGLIPHRDPLEAYAAKSATLGWYTWLETGTTPTITVMVFDELQVGLKVVTCKMYSIDGTSSGNACFIPNVNGVDGTPFLVAVTPTAALVTIPLTVAEGMVSFRRDYASELDTLDTSVVIYAITAWSAK